jgi:hypothetical protein
VTGTVTAGQSAGAFALGNITGNVYAGRDAMAATLGSAVGSVTAGRDALAVAGNAVSGPVTGGRHAGILAFGPVSASVNAASGDAFVVTWGTVGNSVSAGDSAFVAAGDGGSVTVNAPTDAAVVSFGPMMAFVQTGRDGYAWSVGTLNGSLQTGRDGAVISLAAANMGLATGRDAYAWTFDEYHSNIFAGRDALIVSLGDVNGGIFAGGSGLIYAVEDAIGSVTAGEYAGVVTWGTAAGPMSVKGPDGAFGWSYGDFNGFVESSDGSAFLTTYGNGVGAVRGADYAAAYVVGDWVGDIDAGDDAGGVALGSFTANITAGASGYAISEGDVSADITAARDAFVWAIGNISGTYDAGRDAAAVAYGDYNADISAGRDVLLVWARGDLSGTITAGRNVGRLSTADYDIFSYGAIAATIDALNPTGLAGGGQIGRIGAWGQIGGTFEAADRILGVRSGDAVTASLIAPNVPVPVQYDAAIVAEVPFPATPASVAADVLAQAAAEYSLVLAAKAQVATQIAGLLADFAADKTAESTRLADTIAQATVNAVLAHVQAADTLADDTAAANAELDANRGAAAATLAALTASVDAALLRLEAKREEITTARDDAYNQALGLVASAGAAMLEADADIAVAAGKITENADQLTAQRLSLWNDFKELLGAGAWGWHQLPPPPPEVFAAGKPPPDFVPSAWTQHVPFFGPIVAGFQQASFDIQRGLTELFNMDLLGHRGELDYVTHRVGMGYATEKDYMRTYRLPPEALRGIAALSSLYINFVTSAPQLIGPSAAAMRGFEAEMRMGARNTLGGFCTREAVCFTAETVVQRPAGSGGVWYATAGVVLAAGVATACSVWPRRRRIDADEADAHFNADPGREWDAVDGDWPTPPPDDESFQDLCDRLFHDGSDDNWWNETADQPDEVWEAPPQDTPGTRAHRKRSAGAAGNGAAALDSATRPRRTPNVISARAVADHLTATLGKTSPQQPAKPMGAPLTTHTKTVWRLVAGLVFGLSFLLAGFCTFQGGRVSHETATVIAHVEPGQKVDAQVSREALNAAVRDLGPGAAESTTRVHPATWKLLILRAECEWDDGTLDDINVKTLQPPEWVAAHQVYVGGDAPIPLDLVEMGLPEGLRAKVLAIKPCPPIEPGPGRIVLTTVNHLNADVMELTVEAPDGRRETFRPTGSHKFYRETDNRWVSAHDLRRGDRLSGICGSLSVVASHRLRGIHRVYNLTVDGEHVYRVSLIGVLSHNNVCNDVLNESADAIGNTTSRFRLTHDEALEAGLKWLGPGYREIGRPGSGVFVSADGLRRFRIDNNSLLGRHAPNIPHVHYEWLDNAADAFPKGNNHVPIY